MSNKPSAAISKLVFSGGNSFDFGPKEKIILVGPKNSGKSQSLREILAICQNGRNGHEAVIADLEISKSGSIEELQKFLEEEADYVNSFYRYKDWQIHAHHVQFWGHQYLQASLASGFIKNIAADDRLKICDQQSSIAPSEQKSNPQHVLYDDDGLMRKISDLFRQAFGVNIMFDYRGG